MTVPAPSRTRTVVAVLAFNEGEKLKGLVASFPSQRDYELLFVDDGSTDDAAGWLRSKGHQVIRHDRNLGVGASIRTAIEFGRKQGFEFLVIMAGNGKMLPEEIGRLTRPLLNAEADYVQGSRYLTGGQSPNLPRFRHWGIRLFTAMINLILGFKGTDVTCGFRAYRLDLFDHPQINLGQDWLNRYEMEYYIHYKVAGSGLRIVEVPVSMVYPPERRNYSKIQPFTGWWSMLRPWLFLLLGIKK